LLQQVQHLLQPTH